MKGLFNGAGLARRIHPAVHKFISQLTCHGKHDFTQCCGFHFPAVFVEIIPIGGQQVMLDLHACIQIFSADPFLDHFGHSPRKTIGLVQLQAFLMEGLRHSRCQGKGRQFPEKGIMPGCLNKFKKGHGFKIEIGDPSHGHAVLVFAESEIQQ